MSVWSLTALVGCFREPIPSFVMDDALADLPATHQQQIDAELTRRFGTPLNPRLDLSFEEETASDDTDAADAAGEGGTASVPGSVDPEQQRVVAGLTHGAAVFMRRCAGCHGNAGDGKGEAAEFLQPKPRDYRQGVFKFTSTPYGAKPLRKDLMRVVRRGARGTSMPAFPFLPDEDLRDVVDYVILLSYRGELARAVARIAEFDYDEDEEIDAAEFSESLGRIDDTWRLAESQEVLPVTAQPAYSDASIIAGRQAFLSRGCSKCHGQNAEGQTDWLSRKFLAAQESLPEGDREKVNYDAWGEVAPAADLTAGMLHGGRRSIDIYRRIYTGINGTPMPAFEQALADDPETFWHLVHYVRSVVERRDVEGLDQVTAPETAASPSAEGGS